MIEIGTERKQKDIVPITKTKKEHFIASIGIDYEITYIYARTLTLLHTHTYQKAGILLFRSIDLSFIINTQTYSISTKWPKIILT